MNEGHFRDNEAATALTHTVPKADQAFQKTLEQTLTTRLYAREIYEETPPRPLTHHARVLRSRSTAPLAGAAALATVMIAVLGIVFVRLNAAPSEVLTETPTAAQVEQTVPEDYTMIGLPLQPDTLQGLVIGDRIDVLAETDDQLRVITANVLLAEITPEFVMIAAPPWQVTILVWLYRSGESYALRMHTGDVPEAADMTLVDYTFIAPEALPENYVFDLLVNIPAPQGYILTHLPVSIDHVPVTFNGDTLRFWFKEIEVLRITRGTAVTIRLPHGDAANLDYLIDQGMELTFIPDTDAPQQP